VWSLLQAAKADAPRNRSLAGVEAMAMSDFLLNSRLAIERKELFFPDRLMERTSCAEMD
jgi:hypothetical protein